MDEAVMRRRLVEEREALQRLSGSTSGARDPVALDQSMVGRLSRMDAMQMQAMAQEAERRRQAQIRRIDAALKRIEEGEYGACVRCGEDIAARRLDADPAVPLCTACAAGAAD